MSLRQLLSTDPDYQDSSWKLQLAGEMGSLANYWLCDELLDELRGITALRKLLGMQRTKLSTQPGACHILAAAEEEISWTTGPGVVIPVQWRHQAGLDDSGHDLRLPFGLRSIADSVKSETDQMFGDVHKKLRDPRERASIEQRRKLVQESFVGFQSGYRWPDLTEFDGVAESYESAFGALFTGLFGYLYGQSLRPEAWISMAWQERQPKRVTHVREKVIATQRWPHDNAKLYVTVDTAAEPGISIEVVRIKNEEPDLRVALAGFLTQNYIDPLHETPWTEATSNAEIRQTAYNHFELLHRVDLRAGSQYYSDRLVEIVGDACRCELPERTGYSKKQIERVANQPMVCITATRGDTDRLSLSTWRPRKMLLVHDGQRDQVAERVRVLEELAANLGIRDFSVTFVLIPNKNDVLDSGTGELRRARYSSSSFIAEMGRAVSTACESLRGDASQAIVYDASGGTASMKAVMFSKVMKTGDQIIVLESERTKPGSELYHLMQFP